MNDIVEIKGKVKFPITLDPSVWIFDDRKFDLDAYFEKEEQTVNQIEEYTKAVSKHWDREIIEGAEIPTTEKNEKKYKKEILLTSSFGILFQPFLKNASPLENAHSVIIESSDEEITIPIEQAYTLIIQFSKDGKALKDDGPIYAIFEDGSNKNNPIKNIKGFRVE